MTRERYWRHSEPTDDAPAVPAGPPCVRGCTVDGEHLADCPHRDTDHEHDDCGCDGCLPVEAADGVLCRRCASRTRKALFDAAEVVAWLAENVTPSGVFEEDQRVTGSREAPAPLDVTAVDLIDRIVTPLASWAVTHAETVGVKPPDLTLARATTDHRPVNDAGDTVPLATTDRPRTADRVNGAKDTATAAVLVGQLADWHHQYFDSITRQPYAGDWVTEITEAVRAAKRRYPTEPRARRLYVPCPRCDLRTLFEPAVKGVPTYHPDGTLMSAPALAVYCDNGECGAVYTEGDYARLRLAWIAEHGRPA